MIARARAAVLVLVATAGWYCWSGAPQAHKTVVSKFTYYGEVRPILQAKCGQCHVDGGVARTLLTYDGAASFPWGIQQELLSKRMPPFAADPGLVPIKGHLALTTREFDTLMTWAAGGVPEGTPAASAVAPSSEWPLGAPDQIVPMPQAIRLAADQSTLDREVIFAAPAAARRLLRAIDLQPGTPPIVRRAEIAVRSGGADRVVALWLPGDSPQTLERNAAFELPANALLVARIRYERPASVTGSIEDRSRLGLYFAKPGAPVVQSVVVGDDLPTPRGSSRAITRSIARAAHLVAVRPVSGPVDGAVRLTLIDRAGTRTPIIRVTLRPEWPRRYVLATPIALPAGSRVELTVTGSRGELWADLTGDAIVGEDAGGPLRIALEVVP